MQLNRKVTGALAWGGLALVLVIPSADFVSGQLGGASMLVSTKPAAEVARPDAKPVVAESAAKPDAAPMQVAAVDPVADFLSRGRKLPDYISDGSAVPAAAPGASPVVKAETKPGPSVPPVAAAPTVQPTPGPADAQDVAIVSEPAVAPVPMPAEMRPRPRPVVAAPPKVAVVTPPPKPSTDTPLLIDEGPVGGINEPVDLSPFDEADAEDDLIQPPESIRTLPAEDVLLPPANVGDEDDEELAAYLEREGLVGRSVQRLRNLRRQRGDYDSDGFYLDEGPNADDEDSSVIFLSR